jgi:hypothetical protein
MKLTFVLCIKVLGYNLITKMLFRHFTFMRNNVKRNDTLINDVFSPKKKKKAKKYDFKVLWL